MHSEGDLKPGIWNELKRHPKFPALACTTYLHNISYYLHGNKHDICKKKKKKKVFSYIPVMIIFWRRKINTIQYILYLWEMYPFIISQAAYSIHNHALQKVLYMKIEIIIVKTEEKNV